MIEPITLAALMLIGGAEVTSVREISACIKYVRTGDALVMDYLNPKPPSGIRTNYSAHVGNQMVLFGPHRREEDGHNCSVTSGSPEIVSTLPSLLDDLGFTPVTPTDYDGQYSRCRPDFGTEVVAWSSGSLGHTAVLVRSILEPSLDCRGTS